MLGTNFVSTYVVNTNAIIEKVARRTIIKCVASYNVIKRSIRKMSNVGRRNAIRTNATTKVYMPAKAKFWKIKTLTK